MIVRIRFGRGRIFARRTAKTSRAAMVFSTLGTLGAISCGTLGMWRLGQDLGWAGDFVFRAGLLSHWQVWLSASGALQYGAWRLARYSRAAREREIGDAAKLGESDRIRAAASS